jgi:hypothetical protein
MPGRRAPIRFVWARGGGDRYASARWLQVFAHWQGHSVYAGLMLRMGANSTQIRPLF